MEHNLIFNCFCKDPILFREEKLLAQHLRTCEKFLQESPLQELFSKIPLHSLEIPQLVALKLEYNNLSTQVSQILHTSKPYTNNISTQIIVSLSSHYLQFVKITNFFIYLYLQRATKQSLMS